MDLNDSPEEAAFRAEAQAFLREHAPDSLPGWSDREVDPAERLAKTRAWQAKLHAHGWASITWPAEHGGRGLGPIHLIIWNQELSRIGIGQSQFIQGIGLAGPTIIAHGSPEQRARYLERILSAEEIWCQLFSEPGAGSDLAGIAARAVRDGNDWIVTGQKTWCSSAHQADWGILLARTDPSVPKHRGITYLLVDMHAPGIDVRPLRQLDGGEHFNEVFLNAVRVPDANRLGEVGGGWAVAMTTLMNERMAMGGLDALLDLDALMEHARANPARIDDVLRNELGRLLCWSKALELMNARVVTKLGRGQIPDAEGSVMKLLLAAMCSKAAEIGLRISGPDAVLRSGRWQNQFLQAPSLHIGGGTDEIQKNVCAERVLGLPKEPRTDRDIPFDQLPRS